MSEFKGGIYPPHVQKLLDATNARAAEQASLVPDPQPEVPTSTSTDQVTTGEGTSTEEVSKKTSR